MKPFKIVKLIMQICSLTLFLASLIVCAADVSEQNTAFIALMTGFVGVLAFAAVGIFLLNASANTPRLVGHGLVLSSYTVGLTAAIMCLENSSAAIVMLIAVIFLALYYLFSLIVKVIQKNSAPVENPDEDLRIAHIREWKKIMEEGIISPEEYETKRCQLLGIKSQANKDAEKKK